MKRAIALVAGLLVIGFAVAAGGGTAAAAESTATVTVTVTDEDGDPVGGAELTATWDDESTTTTTAGNGKAFVDVPAGEAVVLEVAHDEYVRNSPYEFEAEADGEENVEVVRSGSVSIDTATDNGALEDVQVIVRQNGEIVSTGDTDAEGTFETDRIEQDEYTVTAVKRGFFKERSTVTVDGDVSESFTLDRGSVTVRFNVTDDHYEQSQPVEEATIDVEGSGSVTTLNNGEATVSVPVNADITVTATKQGHEEKQTTVSIEESDTMVDLTISRIPEIQFEADNSRVVAGEDLGVTVTDEYDDPVAGATIRLDGEAVGETDASGRFRVPIEEEGEYELQAAADDLESGTVAVEAISDADDVSTSTEESQLPEEVPEEIREEVPGFGPAVALVALLASALVASRRQ